MVMVASPESVGAPTGDQDLIRKCLKGDSRAWDALVKTHARLVWSIPFRYGLSEEDAEKVFAAVWEHVMHKLDVVRGSPKFSTWLITVASRESWRLINQRKQVEAEASALGSTVSSPDDFSLSVEAIRKLEEQQLVRQAMERLLSPCRQLLWHLYYDPDSPNDGAIAGTLRMAMESIGPQREKCLVKLRQTLTSMGFEEHDKVSCGLTGTEAPLWM